jgi:hypothetical protein
MLGMRLVKHLTRINSRGRHRNYLVKIPVFPYAFVAIGTFLQMTDLEQAPFRHDSTGSRSPEPSCNSDRAACRTRRPCHSTGVAATHCRR